MSIYAEYIWIDGVKPTRTVRSKTKVLWDRHESEDCFHDPDTYPPWGYDGSSTQQAEGNDSDCGLVPVRVFKDPIRGGNHVLLLCEVMNAKDQPHKSNSRAPLRDLLGRIGKKSEGCWFGMEQEHTLFRGSRPLGFGDDRRFPPSQGPYYCGVGAEGAYGRDLIEEHMRACVGAGIKICGTNAEVMPGQWEFQVGPLSPLEAGDHLWVARWLLYRIGEKYGVTATLDPKPVTGDWNGAGMHTNFSTPAMRAEGGISAIENWCREAREYREEHLAVYGDDIEARLTGKHETCSHKHFKWGVSDRTASVRIPLGTAKEGRGYLEDRRPNANACPYAVAEAMLKTAYGLWGRQSIRPAC